MNETDYSRFYVPPVWGMDAGSKDYRDYKETGVCKLTPFLYTGTSPWPFKYSIPGGKECH